MKKFFIAFCCISFAVGVGAQTGITKISKKNIITPTNSAVKQAASEDPAQNLTSEDPAQSLTLKETEFDFGKIPQGKPVNHIFEFSNTGTSSFALNNVQASCGCTTPVWNKDTIEAGHTSEIKVGYNAANEGPFNKTITITWDGDQTKQITIKGEVWKTPATSAPLNTALFTLKNEQ